MNNTLELQGISKSFPGVKALDSIDFSLEGGTIGGLVGENGAGKSTLLKILSGAYIPEQGNIVIDGAQYSFKNTRDALAAGIAIIYQELNLVPEMTVAENMMLGRYPVRKNRLIDFNEMYRTANEQLQYIMEDIDPSVKVKTLPIAQRQMIEISKALLLNARIIAFDEPTSSLSEKEIRNLFRIIRTLREQGKTIIYVSHRLEEVFELCDSVTVFRDGKLVEKFSDMNKVTYDVLVNRMVGRDITDIYNYRTRSISSKPILQVKDFLCPGLKQPATFDLYKGEILGFFGLVGAGRTELMKGLYGAVRPERGTISLGEKELKVTTPFDSIRNGIAFLPEDRKDEGIIPIRSVEENINISSRRKKTRMKIFIDHEWERKNAEEFIAKLDIKTPSRLQITNNLSGGNQQKVILARWLSEDLSVLIMDEPTRGIDVGSKNEIYHLMYEMTEMGISIICISSDLPEIMGICDRMIIMREGNIVTEIPRAELDKEKILSHALPVKQTESHTA